MATAHAVRRSLLARNYLLPFRSPLFAAQALRFASGSSSSASRRHPPPAHEFSKPFEFLGSWEPADDPREAEARLDRLRKEYAKQVAHLRKEYIYEMNMLKVEKQRQDEAKREAVRLANEERKAAKSAAAVKVATQQKAFQEELRQTILKEKAEKLEYWRKKMQLVEQKKASKKDDLRKRSSMWISPEDLDKRILEAIVDTTPL